MSIFDYIQQSYSEFYIMHPHVQKFLPGWKKKREVFYLMITQELEKGEVDKELMSKAFVKAVGDENKAVALYIAMRADMLLTNQNKVEKKRNEILWIVTREIDAGQVVPSLMAKAISESAGDKKAIFNRYVKYRVGQLQEESVTDLTQRRAPEQQKQKEESESACRRAEQERQRQEQEQKKKTLEKLRQQLSRDKGICPSCLTIYQLNDYRPDAPVWLCPSCKQALPKE